MLTVIPSLIKTLTHFYPYLENGEIKSSISNVAKAIGITKKNVKYTRKKITIFDISWLYLFAIYLQFIICFYVFNNNIPLLLIASVMIWIINSKFLRFCDDQPIHMLILSNAIAVIIQSNIQNIWLLISFWIIASPVPLLASFFPSQKCLVIVPIFKPFNIMPIINEMESFLSVVKQDERVIMAFDEPQGEYERVFDGYRILL